MELKSLIAFMLCIIPMAHAWCFKVFSEPNFQGQSKLYTKTDGPSGCTDLPRPFSGNIQSLIFEPGGDDCRYELYEEGLCHLQHYFSASGNDKKAETPQNGWSRALSFSIAGDGCAKTKETSCDP